MQNDLMTGSSQLSRIQHIVVLMLENRSFDHMLGYLYAQSGNRSPSGQAFDGLTGEMSNQDGSGKVTNVYPIESADSHPYFMPGANLGEGYSATNSQLFGSTTAPVPPVATNSGFITDFAYTLGWETKKIPGSVMPGTVDTDVMAMYTPELLPVLSGLARGFAVCDRWFSSVPTETLPNRAFACLATSQGFVADKTTSKYTAPSIFTMLGRHGVSWCVYGYDSDPLARGSLTDITEADNSNFGHFSDFQSQCQSGKLPGYCFLEPDWGVAGNSQHPNYDVSKGEQFIHDVYYAIRKSPAWNQTLLLITYDEHGGCYDHVPPPTNATPPDGCAGEDGFDFKRFGLRVPMVLVSSLIAPGTVLEVPAAPGGAEPVPFDHTSILKTLERRFGLPSLTARDAAAPDVSAILTLTTPRTDDPLADVVVPSSGTPAPHAAPPSHLEQVHVQNAASLPVRGAKKGYVHESPPIATGAEAKRYVRDRYQAFTSAQEVSSRIHKVEDKPSDVEQISDGELEARKIREEFRKVIVDFRDDLAANRLDAVYERIAPMTRASFEKDALAQLVQHPALAPGVEYNTRKTSVTDGLAKVSGVLEGPSGAASYELRCTYANGWLISGLSIDGASILPPP